MKTPVAIKLKAVGGLLIIAPVVWDYLIHEQIIQAMSQGPPLPDSAFHPDAIALTSIVRFGCWFVGTVMIAMAIFSGHKSNIIIGGLLIIMPVVSDFLIHEQIVKAINLGPPWPVFVTRPDAIEMTSIYRFGCWLVGTATIAMAIISRRKSNSVRDALTLIVTGGLIIIVPVLSDLDMHAQFAKATANKPYMPSYELHPAATSLWYRFGCWPLGAIMIATAIISYRRHDVISDP